MKKLFVILLITFISCSQNDYSEVQLYWAKLSKIVVKSRWVWGEEKPLYECYWVLDNGRTLVSYSYDSSFFLGEYRQLLIKR